MKLHPRLSRAAIDLVTRFETFQPQALPAADGGWSIGYGHTRSAREGARVSRADAHALLLYDLTAAAQTVEAALFAPVTQRQFDALTAFAFNIGADNFRRCSALARINSGAELDAADEIERWRHAALGGGAQVVDALVRRRAAEKAHFLGLPEGFSKSPSAVLRPLAAEDGEAAEPAALIEGATPSATLSAVNSVRARLRQLVPDPDHPSLDPTSTPPPPPVIAPAVPAPAPALADAAGGDAAEASGADGPPAPPFPVRPVAETARPVIVSPPAVLEKAVPSPPADDTAPVTISPPPPPPPPAKRSPPDMKTTVAAAPQDHRAPDDADAAGSPPAISVDDVAPSARPGLRRPSLREIYALVAAVGVCLLVAAAVLIIGGKPGLGDLGAGILGALVLAAGVYGLLGPRRTLA